MERVYIPARTRGYSLDGDRLARCLPDLEGIREHTWNDIGPALTCREATAITEMFMALDLDHVAVNLMRAHMDSDEIEEQAAHIVEHGAREVGNQP